ncbi:MAG: putative membrane protein [Oceanicoccus sp.]|jgi:uncharacterized membrane protein
MLPSVVMKRLSEIDALRGLAVALMVLYHFAFDGTFMGVWDFNMYSWWVELGGTFVRFTFLGLVGVSVVLSSRNFTGQLKRGAMVFGFGALITLATLIVIPEYAVWFGILHLIGVSIPLVRLFKGHPWIAAATAIWVVRMGEILSGTFAATPWLLWLGIPPAGFASVDYFPIFPWLAVPLIGLSLGHWVYGERKSTPLKILTEVPGLTWMGRYALAIYVIHQPVIIAGFWVYAVLIA